MCVFTRWSLLPGSKNVSLFKPWAVLALALGLVACSSTSEKPKPKELPANVALLGVKQAWSTRVGEVGFPLDLSASDGQVIVAATDGTLLGLDARNGRELWRGAVGEPIVAGVGGNKELTAVITRSNHLVVVASGRESWRQRLGAQAYTTPLVAGGRVFVATADRTVSAFDAQNGRKLWTLQRPGEPLVLKRPGVLLAVNDTLVLGQGGRLVGLNPNNGTARWEAPVSNPRGTNDVERLVDVVGRVSRVGESLCVRAFQSSVGCVNAARGNVIWTQVANGFEGLHGDADTVVGVESDGRVMAWRRTDGQRLWTSDRLQYRSLSAPLVLGRSVVVGDSNGMLHFVARDDGSPLSRVTTDGSAIVGSPVLVDGTLVAVTRNGGIFGFVPE